MGTWSVTLYGSDAAADIRGDVKALLRTPLDDEAILAALSETYPNLRDESDEEYSDLWLVLADQFHSHAVRAPNVFATAASIIDSGLDLEMKRALGMDERDLAKRAKLLADLRAKWAKPHPKPVKCKVQAKPDAYAFEVGDCVTFPMSQSDAAINPYFAAAEKDANWKQACHGALAVLARGSHLGMFAWYAVARLSLRTAEPATLAQCAKAMVEAELSLVEEHMGDKPKLAIAAGRLPPLHAKRMRFLVAGRLEPKDEAIREDLADVFKPGFVPATSLADGLTPCVGTRLPSTISISRYLTV